jgi:DNA-binding NarL/FixJ family response regulator
MVACLQQAGFEVRGESAYLVPLPDTADLDILLLEYAEASLPRAVQVAAGTPTRLVVTVRGVTERGICDIVDAGAGAILSHPTLTPDLLVASLRRVVAGNATPSGDVLARLRAHVTQASDRFRSGLTGRERSVLRLLADGCDTRDIAADLHLSERTVKNVVHDVLTKLHSRTRAQAVGVATREGVI